MRLVTFGLAVLAVILILKIDSVRPDEGLGTGLMEQDGDGATCEGNVDILSPADLAAVLPCTRFDGVLRISLAVADGAITGGMQPCVHLKHIEGNLVLGGQEHDVSAAVGDLFPVLERVTGSLRIVQTAALAEVAFPALERVGALQIFNNTHLQSLAFPRLITIEGTLIASDNEVRDLSLSLPFPFWVWAGVRARACVCVCRCVCVCVSRDRSSTILCNDF